MFVPSALVGDATLLDRTGPPRLPQLSVTVPFATAVYNSSGFHISYTMQLRHEEHDITWQTTHRYSSFRHFYQKINKRPHKLDFPPLLFTSKANRAKDEVDLRRKKLEEFMKDVVSRCLGINGCTDPDIVIRILKFIDYPFMEEHLAMAHLTLDDDDDDDMDDTRSCSSDIGPSPRIAELIVTEEEESGGSEDGRPAHMPVPMIVTTRWKAPEKRPAPNIGVSLPYVSIAKDINGLWVADVRGERISRRGLMQQRYDEAVSMSEKLCDSVRLLDATEAQLHLQLFRRARPLSWYLRKERDSQSAMREEAASHSRPASGHGLTDSDTNLSSASDAEVVGSPTFHHPRPRASKQSTPATFLPPSAMRSPSPVQHYHLESIGGDDLGPAEPVEGCKCDAKTYCSTSKGDTYILPSSGFTIFVVPPTTAGNA